MAKRTSRPRQKAQSGQHFLKSPQLAADLVSASGISASDLVLEIGAGKGRLTVELASRAGDVVAVENDPRLAALLIERFMGWHNVAVVFGDVLRLPLPDQRFRAFGNIPFGITSDLLHHLLDQRTILMNRADLVVQIGAAIKRARPKHSKFQNIAWGPWWEFRLVRSIAAKAFEPMPPVQAALLSIVQRDRPLLPLDERPAFIEFARQGFSGGEVRRAIRPFVSPRGFARLADGGGFRRDVQAIELSLDRWLWLFHEFRWAK